MAAVRLPESERALERAMSAMDFSKTSARASSFCMEEPSAAKPEQACRARADAWLEAWFSLMRDMLRAARRESARASSSRLLALRL